MSSQLTVSVDRDTPDPAVIARAAAILHQGGVVVAPTETRYGLLACADLPDAVERVYRIKGRLQDQPVAVFLPDIEAAGALVELTPLALALAGKFLPGPLTLVLKVRSDDVSPAVRSGKIGLRVSSAQVIQAILDQTRVPLTATSANVSGLPELSSVAEIYGVFGDRVDLYLDGGLLQGPPSTVVDCTGASPRVLRPGAISDADVRDAVRSRVV